MKFMTWTILASLLFLAACSPSGSHGAPESGTAGMDSAAQTEADPGDCLTEPPAEPVMCTADWRPVCGCDGKTYSNACNAKAAGVTRWEEGECAEGNTR